MQAHQHTNMQACKHANNTQLRKQTDRQTNREMNKQHTSRVSRTRNLDNLVLDRGRYENFVGRDGLT